MSGNEGYVDLDGEPISKTDAIKKQGKLSQLKDQFSEHKEAAICALVAVIILAVALYFFFQTVPNYWVGGGLAVGAVVLGGLAAYLYKRDNDAHAIILGGAAKKAAKKAKKATKKAAKANKK